MASSRGQMAESRGPQSPDWERRRQGEAFLSSRAAKAGQVSLTPRYKINLKNKRPFDYVSRRRTPLRVVECWVDERFEDIQPLSKSSRQPIPSPNILSGGGTRAQFPPGSLGSAGVAVAGGIERGRPQSKDPVF